VIDKAEKALQGRVIQAEGGEMGDRACQIVAA
jgi:hypothetical protein